MSYTTSAAIYFTLLSYLGLPAIFPGDPETSRYKKGQHFSTASVIAEFTEWAALNEEVKDDRFNIVDDTVTTFEDLWIGMGRYFGVETKAQAGWDLMKEIEEVLVPKWEELVEKKGGMKDALKLATWDTFVGSMSAGDWGSVVSMDKARKAGWMKKVDTVGEMERIFGEMKKDGWIPDLK